MIPNQRDLKNQLNQAGFADIQIDKAIDWLEGLAIKKDGLDEGVVCSKSTRVFSDIENKKLSNLSNTPPCPGINSLEFFNLFYSNETVDKDSRVNGIEEEMTANMWFRSYPEVSAIDYIIFGIVALLLPYGIYGYRRDQIRARVEEKFPDFLRDLAEYWKGGLSMTVAIQTLAKGEYGNLNDEVNKMASQISWGVSFGEVLEMFTAVSYTHLTLPTKA